MAWKNVDNDAEYPTRGEAFLNRSLRTEKRGGVEHYVEGQHLAQFEADGADLDDNMLVARLSYCSGLGAVSLPVVKVEGGEWELALPKFRCVGTQVDYGILDLPDDFELTDEMKAALAKLDEEDR